MVKERKKKERKGGVGWRASKQASKREREVFNIYKNIFFYIIESVNVNKEILTESVINFSAKIMYYTLFLFF